MTHKVVIKLHELLNIVQMVFLYYPKRGLNAIIELSETEQV